MQLEISDDMSDLLDRALKISTRQGVFFIGVEHLFGAILEKTEKLPPGFCDAYLNKLMNVLREVGHSTWSGSVEVPEGEVFHTPRCINIIQQATKLAVRRGRDTAETSHMLLAILADALSSPSRALDAMRIDRGKCIKALMAEMDGAAAVPGRQPRGNTPQPPRDVRSPEQGAQRAQPAPAPAAVAAKTASSEERDENAPKFDLTRDLTQMARDDKLRPAIGRDREIFEILQVLTRKTKNNVMLVGEAGVGKTQVVEGLARNLAKGEGADAALPNFRILELNLAALMSGTQYRGAFEERLLTLLEQLKNSQDTVLFIDEAHLIMGAGATDGDGMDMANLLKPAMARGEIRCIGATTLGEYRKFVERDPAIERRFQMIRLEELSEEATFEVLAHIVPSLQRHHRVRISRKAVESTVHLAQRYMPNRRFPDKAIDVLDQACARFRLKMTAAQWNTKSLDNTIMPSADDGVTPHDIRKVISQMTAIPIEDMTAEERLHLNNLEQTIKERLIGQDEAVTRSVSAIKKSRAGLADPNRPDAVMLFLGPSGVGKTQLAKLLATNLFGSSNHLVTFDMSEYIEEHSVSRLLGAPPGYAGSEEEGRLTGAVRAAPFSILLFDEIEKAHPRIFDIFLPIFDEGRLKDSRGRDASFKNCIIILTSNIGADIISNSSGDDVRPRLVEELRNHFRPEFINRIDEIIPFFPLLGEDVRSILRLEIDAIRGRLRDKKIGVRMYQRAYQFLIDKGYSPQFGARELRRLVDQEITTPVSELVIKGVFKRHDVINVMEEGGKLVFLSDEEKEAKLKG